jgi:DNA (cytosine-5)-methyltransferase 1
MDAQSLDRPLPTITAQSQHLALCEPFIVTPGGANLRRPRSVSEPLPTVTGSDRFAVVEPFILQQQSGGLGRSVDQPLPTIATGGAQALVQPFIVEYHSEKPGERPRTRDVDDPLPTATTENRFGLVEPFILPPLRFDPTRTVSVDAPLPTITATGGRLFGLVEPFIAAYYGTQNVSPVSEPLPTVTTKDRFALVLPMVDGRVLDIHLRMLKPRELARAMGFDDDYRFSGNQGEQVKQIGNAWGCEQGKALCAAILRPYAARASAGVRMKETA